MLPSVFSDDVAPFLADISLKLLADQIGEAGFSALPGAVLTTPRWREVGAVANCLGVLDVVKDNALVRIICVDLPALDQSPGVNRRSDRRLTEL